MSLWKSARRQFHVCHLPQGDHRTLFFFFFLAPWPPGPCTRVSTILNPYLVTSEPSMPMPHTMTAAPTPWIRCSIPSFRFLRAYDFCFSWFSLFIFYVDWGLQDGGLVGLTAEDVSCPPIRPRFAIPDERRAAYLHLLYGIRTRDVWG